MSDTIRFGGTKKTANYILEGTTTIDEINDDPISKRLLEIFKTSKQDDGSIQ